MKEVVVNQFEDFAHCALLYSSPTRELETLKHYVARFPEDEMSGEWLFDAFLFIHLLNTSGVAIDHARVNEQDWKHCFDVYFHEEQELRLLDRAIGEVKAKIGDPPTKRKVILTIPYPHPATTNFGDIDGDGQDEDLSTEDGRRRAMQWYIDEAIRRFEAENYENIELWGFYWVHEEMDNDGHIAEVASKLIHDRGYRFLWIPYYQAPGYENASKYFDVTIMQPNYAFNAWTSGLKVAAERLENCWEHCSRLGYGIEMELRSHLMYDIAIFQRYLAYGSRNRRGYQFAPNAYFFGAEIYSQDTGPTAHRVSQLYEMLCDYVTGKIVPDPDVYIDNFTVQKNSIYLLTGTDNRISTVELLLDTHRIGEWNGLVRVDALCGNTLTPSGWTLAEKQEGERFQTVSVPVSVSTGILQIHIETYAGELPRDAICYIHLDCLGKETFTNYCLDKPYTFLPDLVDRPYGDNAEKNLLINRDVDGQRIGWFSKEVEVWLDLGEEVDVDTVEVYSQQEKWGGIEPPAFGQVLFSLDKSVRNVYCGVGEVPSHMRSGILGAKEQPFEEKPNVICQSCQVKRDKTRYVSLLLHAETMRWMMITQIRVLSDGKVLPIQKYRLGTHPSAQLGTLYEDDGKKLTDGVETTGFGNAMVMWEATSGSRTLVVDLESVKTLHQISLHTLSLERKDICDPADVLFSVSADGVTWHPPYSVNRSFFATNGSGDVVFMAQFPNGVSAQYLKAEIVPGRGYCAISEITAY